MSEVAAIEKLDTLITESQSPSAPVPRAFELNRPFFEIGFPVTWPPLGEINVRHKLRRPKLNEELEYKKKLVSQHRVLGGGRSTDERTKTSEATIWLWDQISVAIKGYPGFEQAHGDQWIELTPELRAQMRDAHKESAIQWLYACDVEVLEDEGVMTFSGSSEWVVLLKLGQRGAWYASIKLRIAEWDTRQKDKFEGSFSISSSETQGKTRLVTSAVNQKAYRELFAATLLDVSADPAAGLHDTITVDGEPFSKMNKAKFADAFLGDWQVDVMVALVQLWWGK
jgi:hypothetical protein